MILDYERLSSDLWEKINCLEGEFVLQRNPFRWMKNGHVVSNAYEMFDVEQVCEDNDWEIVVRYGEHIVIAKQKPQP